MNKIIKNHKIPTPAWVGKVSGAFTMFVGYLVANGTVMQFPWLGYVIFGCYGTLALLSIFTGESPK